MIDYVIELVNKTTSNSLFMFLFCNFIIVLILVGNSKPVSHHNSNPGSKKSVFISDPVLSSQSGFEELNPVLSSKSGFEKSDPVLSLKSGFEKSDPVLFSKPGKKLVLISKSVLSSKPGLVKPVLVMSKPSLTSKPGLQEPGLICKSPLSSKTTGSEQSLTSNPGLQEHRFHSKSTRSTKPTGSEQLLTAKPGLRRMSSGLKSGSIFIEKVKKENLLDIENESQVECLLRRRSDDFIRKVNTQWRSENIQNGYLVY